MKKLFAIVLAALMCVALLAGCGTKDADSAAAGTETKTAPVVDINEGAECKMAYIPMGSGQEDYPVILNGMQEALTLYPNVTLITCDPGFNPTNQIDMMKEFINQEVDVIFINAMDGIALNSTIAEAEDAGIVVISINNGVEGDHTAHIQNTTYDAGVEAAKFMTNVAPENAKTVILDVPAELKATCTMGQGFEDYANETRAPTRFSRTMLSPSPLSRLATRPLPRSLQSMTRSMFCTASTTTPLSVLLRLSQQQVSRMRASSSGVTPERPQLWMLLLRVRFTAPATQILSMRAMRQWFPL